MQTMTATYSPEDNKLRLHTMHRLDKATYDSIVAAGFRFAPKQDFFVAPAWTPEREDVLLALCGEIEDEQSTVADRAADRSERFEGYSDRRLVEAEAAHAQVDAITEHIPFGQPILVGHHSEKRARKDAERIENGMRKAIKLAETSRYWDNRARGAARYAAIKADPGVRERRIKGLEADARKFSKNTKADEALLKRWEAEMNQARALALANYSQISRCFTLEEYPRAHPASQYEGQMSLWSALDGGVITYRQAATLAQQTLQERLARARRWLHHIEGRLAYERAQLEEQGGATAARFEFVRGGQVLSRGEWLTILRINKGAGGAIVSITTSAPSFMRAAAQFRVAVERVSDYRPPADGSATAGASLPPIVNYPAPGFREITAAEWSAINRDYKGVRTEPAAAGHSAYRFRRAMFFDAGRSMLAQVYITDKKRVDIPAAVPAQMAA